MILAPITPTYDQQRPLCHNICSEIINVATNQFLYININKICIYFISEPTIKHFGACHMIIPSHPFFP